MYRIPYFGVLVFYFRALKRAFSAPRIYTVDAGYFIKLERPPECEISFAPTVSPIIVVRLGATSIILLWR